MTTSRQSPGVEEAGPAVWRKLDRRTVAVTVLRAAGVAVAAGFPTGAAIAGSASPLVATAVVVPVAVVLIAAAGLFDDVRWRRTSYRVLPDRVELRKGIVVRSRRTLSRHRIRAVDITAPPLLRAFGLVNVKLGTGEQTSAGESSLVLHPVTRTEADDLRTVLLHRDTRAASTPAPTDGRLATFQPSWVRFAPMSFLTPTLGLAFFGVILQVAEWFGLRSGVVSWALDLLRDLSLPLAVLALLLTGLAVGSMALFLEMWGRFRLEREPNGTLRVRRGLLTRRSISLEERRLRGVELVEPLGNRLVGAARVDAVATGLVRQNSKERTDHKTLLPPAPRREADRVAAVVLRESASPTESVRLLAHPIAARGRRVRWALLAVAAVVVPLLVVGLTAVPVLVPLAGICAAVLVPVALAVAFDAYRNLGHGLAGDYLVTRSGALRRSTVALRRRGIIGWTATQSIFQRRKGLLTLTATTAAGAGAYSIYDIGQAEGLEFAEAAVGELFGPFLERV
ncbi:putative membrane protein [Saccharomonospora amisosensis]|uniref:Putative membrane protein n=1 Tax=Saccharomonospora amisosensis TaxID=1128677 RepID=A0A7X5URH5_9PSEU|nr:PH domain-containing protein [Saccharomonospora amisosensis]NIJ12857.1 putative membrane protein [Saccharomonospora amisosensis]